MTLTEYVILTLSSLFVVVDPIAIVPAFLAMTPNDSSASRLRTARLACVVAGSVLAIFTLCGRWIFHVMGITLPAFEIAGSILLMRIALDMLYARRSGERESAEEVEAGAAKEEIAITPLGVPMLAGPGAISTSLILMNEAQGIQQHVALFGCFIVVALASYWILRLGIVGARWLNPLAMKLTTRLMGLLLAALAIQFFINGLVQIGVPLAAPSL